MRIDFEVLHVDFYFISKHHTLANFWKAIENIHMADFVGCMDLDVVLMDIWRVVSIHDDVVFALLFIFFKKIRVAQ